MGNKVGNATREDEFETYRASIESILRATRDELPLWDLDRVRIAVRQRHGDEESVVHRNTRAWEYADRLIQTLTAAEAEEFLPERIRELEELIDEQLPDMPVGEGPRWLLLQGVDEQWQAPEWAEWERLRRRFAEFGVELDQNDLELTGIAAYKGAVPIFEQVDKSEQYPLRAALHRLIRKVAEAARSEEG